MGDVMLVTLLKRARERSILPARSWQYVLHLKLGFVLCFIIKKMSRIKRVLVDRNWSTTNRSGTCFLRFSVESAEAASRD
jgi:hypothetical protein